MIVNKRQDGVLEEVTRRIKALPKSPASKSEEEALAFFTKTGSHIGQWAAELGASPRDVRILYVCSAGAMFDNVEDDSADEMADHFESGLWGALPEHLRPKGLPWASEGS